MKDKIDIVVLWVDGNDPKWIEEYNQYSNTPINKDDVCRFRDWGIMKYWFRGIANYAPWVNHVFFVTNGQKPDFINENCEKLILINHSDYIDKKYLPVFNSCAIELGLHRIPGISEKFIYFNDDFFIVRPTDKEYFFKEGLPCDMGLEGVFHPLHDNLQKQYFNNAAYINQSFGKREVYKTHWRKWLNLKYGVYNLFNLYMLPIKCFFSFKNFHTCQPFLKSTFEEVWEKYGPDIQKTTMTRFRSDSGVNQYLFRNWQLVKGDFYPVNLSKTTHYFDISDDCIKDICNTITKQKKNVICLNDNYKGEHFEAIRQSIIDSFEKILPNKCIFEK